MTDKDSPHPHAHLSPWSDLPAGFADHLDLEAGLSTPVTQSAIEEAASSVKADPSLIVDLGPGTGAGTVALAARFPNARVHGVDMSQELLGRLRAATAAAGISDRVETHLADLDGDWPALVPGGADLVWAALSLHHVADPALLLRRAFGVLRPGGVLVVIEMTGTLTMEPADLGSGREGLRHRLATALAEHGHPGTADWPTLITEAGFTGLRHRETAFTVSATTGDGAGYLTRRLRSHRERLAGTLTGEDLAGLDGVIEALEAGTSEISYTSGRAIWVAARPEPAAPHGIDRSVDDTTAAAGDRPAASRPEKADAVVAGDPRGRSAVPGVRAAGNAASR